MDLRSRKRKMSDDVFSVTGASSGAKNKRKEGEGKLAKLERLGRENPDKTPSEILTTLNPEDLFSKVNAKFSGDHSPSVINYNNSSDEIFRASGRGKTGDSLFVMNEENLPTLQFRGPNGEEYYFRRPNMKEYFVEIGAEVHSVLTTLREIGGVGENVELPFEDLLDKTLFAYRAKHNRVRPYLLSTVHDKNKNIVVEPDIRVSLYDKNKNNIVINKAVHPFIAQAAFNMSLRYTLAKASLKLSDPSPFEPAWASFAPPTEPIFCLPGTMSDLNGTLGAGEGLPMDVDPSAPLWDPFALEAGEGLPMDVEPSAPLWDPFSAPALPKADPSGTPALDQTTTPFDWDSFLPKAPIKDPFSPQKLLKTAVEVDK
jgi:hypothetical protein